MMIHSPKTEHHPGKSTRVCPIFPELRPYLDELDQLAPTGSVYVLEKSAIRARTVAIGRRRIYGRRSSRSFTGPA
jgi:hypothetical protein